MANGVKMVSNKCFRKEIDSFQQLFVWETSRLMNMTSKPSGMCVEGNSTADLLPPASCQFRVQDRGWLLLEVLWMCLLAVPAFLALLFHTVFPPPGKSIKGQVIVVTGSGRGLGKELALRFAQEGGKVAVVDFNEKTANETAVEIIRYGGIAKAYRANVARPGELASLHAAVARDLGPVNVLVNNAGLVYAEPIERMDEREVTTLVAVNLLSHFWAAREFLPAMKSRNAGHIVAIGSMSALRGCANVTAYAACKFGLTGFMESLRDELEQRKNNNIKTTVVHPYFINTSESFTRRWNVRLPPMPIDHAVDEIMNAIRREDVLATVPGHLFLGAHFIRVMPLYLRDLAKRIFYVKIIPSTTKEKSCILDPIVNDTSPQNTIN